MTDLLNKTKVIFDSSSELYLRPSLLDGMSSVFNIFGNNFNFNYSKSSNLADNNAIRKDWDMVGQDLSTAINSHVKI